MQEQSQSGHKGEKCSTQWVERGCLHLTILFSCVIWGPQDDPCAVFVRAKPNGQATYCHALFIDRHLCTCIHELLIERHLCPNGYQAPLQDSNARRNKSRRI